MNYASLFGFMLNMSWIYSSHEHCDDIIEHCYMLYCYICLHAIFVLYMHTLFIDKGSKLCIHQYIHINTDVLIA